MVTSRYLAAVLAALVVSAGVGAAATGTGGTGGPTDTTVMDDPTAYAVDASYADGTVTLTVTANGTGVAGFTVAADGTTVGTTGANGTAAFDPVGENGTLTVGGENVTGEFTYTVQNGTVSLEGGFAAVANGAESDETTSGGNASEARGPPPALPGPASRTAAAVHEVIRMYQSGELGGNTTLGEAVSAVARGEKSPDEVGKPAHADRPDGSDVDAGGRSDERGEGTDEPNGAADGDRGKPAHAGNDGRENGAGDDRGGGENDRGNGHGNGDRP